MKSGKPLLSKAEERDYKLERLAGMYERANRVLSGRRDLGVTWVSKAPIPAAAWTAAEASVGKDPHVMKARRRPSKHMSICFNKGMLAPPGTPIDRDFIVRLTGVNYHELCHVMWTPFKGLPDWFKQVGASKTTRRGVTGSELQQAFNMLEDQRIESMLLAMYKGLSPYFVTMLAEYVINASEPDKLWPLLHGRRYLPQEVRDQFRGIYANQPAIPHLEKIIDEYRLLRKPLNDNPTRELIEDFAYYMRLAGSMPDDPFGHGSHPCVQVGGSGDEVPDYIVQANIDQTDAQDSGEAEGEGSGDKDGEGEGSGGVGAAIDAAEDALNQAKSSQQVNGDVRDAQSQMNGGNTAGMGSSTINRVFEKQVRSDITATSARVVREFEEIVEQNDPGWHTHKSSGRINVQRAMQGADLDTVFDVWDEGVHDTESMEVVILLDASGSMSGTPIENASAASWIIKHALDGFENAVTTVLSFEDDTCEVVYDNAERAASNTFRTYSGGGGTDPARALNNALGMFHFSNRKHQILFILSDGEWGNEQNSERIIDKMNGAGVVTASMFMVDANSGGWGWGTPTVKSIQHHCQEAAIINGWEQMSDFMRRVVRRVMTSAGAFE